jgi:hypothetical protein
MKKILQITATLLLGCTLTNCVDDSIDLNDLNKDIVFSNEKGISIQIGTMAPVFFVFDDGKELSLPPGIYQTIPLTPVHVKGVFTEELYDYFVIDVNGTKQPLGDIVLNADFYASLENAEDKVDPDDPYIHLDAEILGSDGKPVPGIDAVKQKFDARSKEPQKFEVRIEAINVNKLEAADGLIFTYTLRGNHVDKTDYILMNNVTITLEGGVKISLD